MKKGQRVIGLTAGIAILVSFLGFLAACKTMTDEQVKGALQLEVLGTAWVAKEYKQWPRPKLTLVPTITFRVKNISAEPLRYVYFNGIFKNKDDADNLGDHFLLAIGSKPVLPGEWSDPITLKCNFGVEGKRLEDFKSNPAWKTYFVRIFAQMGGSRHVLLGEWPVSRKIDFKEDQPAHMGADKK